MFSAMNNNINYFEKLYFILMITFHTFNGQSIKADPENSSICGLPKKQIQKALLHSKKSFNGIAINARCLEQNSNNSKCFSEQNKLIECLQKEYLLAKEQVNEITEETNVPNVQNFNNEEIKRHYLQNIVEGNKELDNVARDYEETIIKNLESIDDLITKRICADHLNIALTNTKIELTAAIYQQVLKNINKICKLGVYSTECINLMNSTRKNIKPTTALSNNLETTN